MSEGEHSAATPPGPAPVDPTAPADPAAPGEPAAAPKRRGRGRALVIALVLLAVLVALVFLAPTPIARLVVAAKLDEMGVESTGVETLTIDPWHRRIALGPVRFRKGTGAYGSLDRLGVHFGLRELIHRRVLVRDVRIEGLDLAVSEDKDGAFAINGVPVPAAADAGAEEEADAAASTWMAGLGSLDVRASRLSFVNAAGGTLGAAIDRLTLAGFRPWQRDNPGIAALTARVNDIALDVQAEARPFAEERQGRFEITLDDADLGKIERFIGPLGLTRSAGRVKLVVRGTATTGPAGGIALAAAGRADLAGLDLGLADGPAAACAASVMDFDLRAETGSDGGGTVTGTLNLALTDGALGLGDGTSVRLPAVRLGVPDLALAWRADGGLKATGAPEVSVDRPGIEGPTRLVARAVSATLPATALDLDAKALTVAAKPRLRVDELGIEEPVRLAAAGVQLDLGELALQAAASATTLDATGTARIERLALEGPTAVSADRIALDLATLTLQAEPAGLSVDATGKLDLTPVALTLSDPGGGEALRAGAQAIGLAFRDLGVRQTGAETAIGATLRLDGAAIEALMPYGGAQGRLAGESLTVAAEPLSLTLGADRTALSTTGTAELGGLGAELPAIAGAPAISAAIATVQLAVPNLDAELAGESPRIEARFQTTHEELSATIGGGELARARLATLTLTGGRLDAGGALAAESVLLRKPDVELNDRLFTAFAATPAGKPTPPAPGSQAAPGIALGRIAVADGGTLVFVDGSVRPPLRLKTEIKTLEAAGLDTGDPNRRTDIKLDTVVNDFSKVQLLGWMQPFATAPSFDLSGRVGDLELPAFSPYAAQAVGLNLEKGRLSAKLDARSAGGAISGRADFDVDNLGFSALSKEDAERLSARMGVPIETVVGLLQDSKGRIELGIPISGDLRSPEFDLSQAIGRAVSGAITAAVTAPFQLLYQPVALVAGAIGGGGVALKPVVFAAGDAQLDATAAAFADALAKMLQERPKLTMQVCGRATAADLEAALATAPAAPDRKAATDKARPALQALATDRARAVRQYLASKGRIRADRIGECRSSFDPADQGPPRAEFRF